MDTRFSAMTIHLDYYYCKTAFTVKQNFCIIAHNLGNLDFGQGLKPIITISLFVILTESSKKHGYLFHTYWCYQVGAYAFKLYVHFSYVFVS